MSFPFLRFVSAALPWLLTASFIDVSKAALSSDLMPDRIVGTEQEPVAKGPFRPTWQSLENDQAPDWFRNAKFGIWAHWGPQYEAEAGDWYARSIYQEGTGKADFHRKKYGHPSEFGFKDVIHAWKADKWEPERLKPDDTAIYKLALH